MIEKQISWRAAEYEHNEKDVGWYIVIGGIALIAIIIVFWQRNFFFGIFLIVATLLLFTIGNRRPRILDFTIDEEKILLGKKEYRYEELDHFAIRNRIGHLDELIVMRKTRINPILHIPIDEKLIVRAREMLLEKIPEVQYDESLLENIADWLGF